MTDVRDARRAIAEGRAVIDEYIEIMQHVAVCTNTEHGHKRDITPGEALALHLGPIVGGWLGSLDDEHLGYLDEDELTTIVDALAPVIETQQIAARHAQRYAAQDDGETP